MNCKNIIKKNGIAYVVDIDGNELDIENFNDINLYEKKNNCVIKDFLNNFIQSKDNGFKTVIDTIEEMVDKYRIDYYVYGNGKEVSEDNVALMYNLKNRNSVIDCYLKVFYSEQYNKISYMICFSEGASGIHFGYEFYRYFTLEDFFKIERLLLIYFSNNDTGVNDKILLKDLANNAIEHINNYYSE